MRRRLLWLLGVSGFLAGGFLAVGFAKGHFSQPLFQSFLSATGVAVGAWIALSYFPPIQESFPLLKFAGTATILASQCAFHTLVWSEPWRTLPSALGWRLWWLAAIPALSFAHLHILHRAGARWKNKSSRTALLSTLAFGVLQMGLVLRQDFLMPPHDVWLVAMVLTGIASLGSSSVIVWRWWRSRLANPQPWPRALRVTTMIVLQLLMVLGAFYTGRISVPPANLYELMPSALAGLSEAEIQQMVAQDLQRLKTYANGMAELIAGLDRFQSGVERAMDRERRTLYSPKEDDEFRRRFITFLSFNDGLKRMMAIYSGFESVRDPVLRDRCFLIGYTATATTMEWGTQLVKRYRDNTKVRAKLNEEDLAWGIRAGQFDKIYYAVTARKNLELMEEFDQYADHRQKGWIQTGLFAERDLQWLKQRIEQAETVVVKSGLSHSRAWFSRITRRVQRDTYSPVYGLQSMVSSLIGDIRISRRPPLIRLAQIDEAKRLLKPGDIIIERRNWFLSNAFLPGFWPHAALYVGTPDDLRALGLDKHPDVKAKWEAFSVPDDDGHPNSIIEAVSEGVVFNSLHHSIHADYVAVLRPRNLKPEQIAEAIAAAFRHVGKPYDFDFDFGTSDKLVCTELVHRSYMDKIQFPTVILMGKPVIPALEIVRKFRDELGTPRAELDFVLFLDVHPGAIRAHFGDAQALGKSVDRPREFGE